MNLKLPIKSYRFWLSIASALLLLIQAIGEPLGLKINEERYMAIVNALLGIFVVLGIISSPNVITNNTDNKEDSEESKENKDKIE